jgi:hypothetical protein
VSVIAFRKTSKQRFAPVIVDQANVEGGVRVGALPLLGSRTLEARIDRGQEKGSERRFPAPLAHFAR